MHLHGSNGGGGARVHREDGEGRGGASLFNIVLSHARREMCLACGWRGSGDEFRAVHHLANILAEDGKLSHCSLESRLQLRLVVCAHISEYVLIVM